MSERTAIIYNKFSEGLNFFVVEGDFRYLDGVFINSEEESFWDDLTNLLYDGEGGRKYDPMELEE